MSTGAVVAIIVVVVIVAAVLIGVTVAARRRRLQRRFGPEYDRVVGERQSQLKADSELASRERRVRELDIRPLSESARANFATQWRAIQEEFVDQPEDAVVKAQHLVTVVMNDRGYPTDGHDQMLADLSVEHAGTLEHYRSAYAISQGAAEGNASTEDLRQAMIRYRTLFSDLLGDPAAQEAGIRGAAAGPPPAGASATNPDITNSAAGRTNAGRVAADPAGHRCRAGRGSRVRRGFRQRTAQRRAGLDEEEVAGCSRPTRCGQEPRCGPQVTSRTRTWW